jgi:hypothetical protein
MTFQTPETAIQLRQLHPGSGYGNGTPTGNYAEVYVGTLTLTFSYETVIALAIPGVGRIGTKRRWSSTTSKHQRAAGPYRFELEPSVFDSVVAAVQVGIDRALNGRETLTDSGVKIGPYVGIREAVANILQDAGEIDGEQRVDMIGTVNA